MSPHDFEVGKEYRYSEIPEEDTETITVSEYGLEYLSNHAIHVRFNSGLIVDVWFIYSGQRNEGIFKCVYNE